MKKLNSKSAVAAALLAGLFAFLLAYGMMTKSASKVEEAAEVQLSAVTEETAEAETPVALTAVNTAEPAESNAPVAVVTDDTAEVKEEAAVVAEETIPAAPALTTYKMAKNEGKSKSNASLAKFTTNKEPASPAVTTSTTKEVPQLTGAAPVPVTLTTTPLTKEVKTPKVVVIHKVTEKTDDTTSDKEVTPATTNNNSDKNVKPSDKENNKKEVKPENKGHKKHEVKADKKEGKHHDKHAKCDKSKKSHHDNGNHFGHGPKDHHDKPHHEGHGLKDHGHHGPAGHGHGPHGHGPHGHGPHGRK